MTADNWVQDYTVEMEVARRERAFSRGITSPAFWKLFGCFIVPAASAGLVLDAVAGERASELFQLISSLLLAGLFMWRLLLHRRAYLSKLKAGTPHNG